MKTKKTVCVIAGDHAAPEAMWPTVDILENMNLDIEFIKPLTGVEAVEKYGEGQGLPDEAKKAIDAADTTLYGAGGGITLGTAYLRFAKKCWAHVRPIRYLRGAKSPMKKPEGIDWVFVREGLEGLYPGREGDLRQLTPIADTVRDYRMNEPLPVEENGYFAIRIITEKNTKNIARYACEFARKRKAMGYPGRVTVAAKYNLLRKSDEFFRRTVEETIKAYPDLEFEQIIIDAFAQKMVLNPHDLDVVVMPNELGDLLSDGAAGTIGGLGLAPSGVYGNDYAYFEPIHGSAPDIAGKNIINPTATILSAALMLDYLGLGEAGARLIQAVETVYMTGEHLTPDQGGTSGTVQFCEAVKACL
jgi:isocitrate/isopropylmalate dehydrogenase